VIFANPDSNAVLY